MPYTHTTRATGTVLTEAIYNADHQNHIDAHGGHTVPSVAADTFVLCNATQTLTNKTFNNLTVVGGSLTNMSVVKPTMDATGWPSFSVHKNGSNQSLGSLSVTKITFNTEEFDTNSNFASSRFTPTVAGKYILTTALTLNNPGANQWLQVYLYKNGTTHKRVSTMSSSSGVAITGDISAIVNANGTSDYFEVYAEISVSGTILGAFDRSFFTGSRIG